MDVHMPICPLVFSGRVLCVLWTPILFCIFSGCPYFLLKIEGRVAMVVPDNVLFEGGAGEKVRRNLLQKCRVHTLLRLPTGIWYSPGVKANVIFFDKKEGRAQAWTDRLWVYDLRTNQHFTLKQKPIQRGDFDEFVECYKPGRMHKRKPI
jgi:type I restriction enzyme M protein